MALLGGRLDPMAREQLRGHERPARLVADGVCVALRVEVAQTLWRRTVGLLGRREVPVALLLHPCSSVHSLGMRVDLEVAYLDRDLRVIEVVDLPRWRMQLPRRHAVAVLEAAPGALTALGVRADCRLGLARG